MPAPIDWQTDAAFAYRTEPPTVCSRVLRPLRLVLEERGLASAPAIEALEVRYREGDERVHVADWYALLEDALARTANPLLGLYWAQKAATVSGTIGLVEYLLRTSRSLRGALACLVSYGCLFQDDLAFDSVFEGAAVRLRLRSCRGSPIPPVWSEAVLAYCSFLLTSLLGFPAVSSQHWVLSFTHPGPAATDSYRRLLRACV
ncbi:MAG TPA: AraC family transcriptional regulator ligand-binding domain-containing protein, partial [Polyangiaceae bacterium]|nr:AraC family transcriptional regulator ligand-binding domain-containing protein [Polyangiaceae bacterium]